MTASDAGAALQSAVEMLHQRAREFASCDVVLDDAHAAAGDKALRNAAVEYSLAYAAFAVANTNQR